MIKSIRQWTFLRKLNSRIKYFDAVAKFKKDKLHITAHNCGVNVTETVVGDVKFTEEMLNLITYEVKKQFIREQCSTGTRRIK